MGQGFLIDTNFITSVIVKIEVLGYIEPSPEKIQLLTEFIDTAKVLSLDDTITQKTIELRRIKKIKLGDAIIAATALVYDLVVISRNTSDFKNIHGLKVFDPHHL